MRRAAKTASYGAIHVIVATMVAYALSGDLTVALGIGLIEPLVQTGVFAVHDWLWERQPTEQTRRHCGSFFHSH